MAKIHCSYCNKKICSDDIVCPHCSKRAQNNTAILDNGEIVSPPPGKIHSRAEMPSNHTYGGQKSIFYYMTRHQWKHKATKKEKRLKIIIFVVFALILLGALINTITN